MKISKFIKNNYKFLIGVIVGLLLSGTGVYAANTIYSKNVTYDNSNSGLSATNVQDALDETYSKCIPPSSTDKIINLYNDGSSINTVHIGGDTSNPQVKLNATQGIMLDNNGDYRYYGADPNNYVSFNGETWRIIGAFNNVDDGTGTKETRLKIIRDESIGDYSWDSSESTINSGYGVNDWSKGDDGACPRATTWTGKIGIIYPSDYVYATDLSLCIEVGTNYDESICRTNNWMPEDQWTIMPSSSMKSLVFRISSSGEIYYSSFFLENTYQTYYEIYPVLYLKSSITITGGFGTSSDPYTLG